VGAISNLPNAAIPNEVDLTPVVAFALQLGVPFRASSSYSTISSKYRVLPRQPLSRLGELLQGLDRVVSFPMQEETVVGGGGRGSEE